VIPETIGTLRGAKKLDLSLRLCHPTADRIPLAVTESMELDEALMACIDRITIAKRELRALVKSGGTASIAVGWFCKGDSGGTISSEVLARMSRLKLTLDFYLYFSTGN